MNACLECRKRIVCLLKCINSVVYKFKYSGFKENAIRIISFVVYQINKSKDILVKQKKHFQINFFFHIQSCGNHVHHNEALLQKLYVAVTDLDRMMMSGNSPPAKFLT